MTVRPSPVGLLIGVIVTLSLESVWAQSPPIVEDLSEIPGGPPLEDLDLGSLLDTPLEVWSASKSQENIHEAPAIITTVTREQMAIWGDRSVSEVLSRLLGFFPVDDHVLPNLAVRGISGGLHADSSIVKVLIDGHSVAFHSTSGNWLGPELIPLTAVDRIEIIRGPASALFGADAFLGVINIKTRSGQSVRGGDAWLGAGQTGQRLATDADVAGGAAAGAFDFLLAARHNREDLSGLSLPDSSPAPVIPGYRGEGREAQGLDQQSTSVFGRVTYRPRAGTELGAFGYFSTLERGAEFSSLYQLVHGANAQGIFSENRTNLWQLRTGLLWEQTLSSTVTLATRLTLFRGAPTEDNRQEVGSDFYYVRRRFGFQGGDLDTQAEWRPLWRGLRNTRFVAGASAFMDDEELPSRVAVSKQQTLTSRPGDVLEDISIHQDHRTFVNLGSYLHGTLKLVPRYLSATAGVRYDWHNAYGGQLSERVGLVSSPARGLNLKLLYGNAFKAPSPLLLHAVPAAIGDVSGNPDLKPQYVHTLELLASWEPRHYVTVSSSVAYNFLRDKTEFVQQGISQVARNVAKAQTISSESKLELRYRSRVHGYLSVELQRTIRQTGQDGYAGEVVGSRAGVYPNLMLHSGVVLQLPGLPLRTMLQASLIGERRPSDTNITLNGGSYTLPAYVMLDAGLSSKSYRPFGDDRLELTFALLGKNLLGATGPAPGFGGIDYPLVPRSILFQTRLLF